VWYGTSSTDIGHFSFNECLLLIRQEHYTFAYYKREYFTMKKNHIVLSVISLFLCTALFAQKKDTVKVWGNCGMCKKTIETAAKSSGAAEADWNTETKILAVSYNGEKTTLAKIEQAVAASGYDTKNFTAPEEAYNKLPSCCQYDRKASVVMATSASMTPKSDDCCQDDKGTKTMDCCKDGKCSMSGCCKDGKCVKNKDGKTADCCKDGKCGSGDCCKKA
jgi:periplasmic mercuric ion binding protein